MAERVAAIDIGTNSVLCLIAEGESAAPRRIHDEATITRLGQGVDASGELAPEAIERTLRCLARYADTIRSHGATRVAAVGTSALRDARGGEQFLDRAERILGARPQVISGHEEALLTFEGALLGLEPEGRLAVFDVGGGSTEIIVGRRIPGRASTLATAVSVDVGAVRLTERHVRHDPPGDDEIAAIVADVRAALAQAPRLAGLPLVGVAGTVTTLAAMLYDVVPYDGERVHGAVIAQASLHEAVERLRRLTTAERRAIGAIDPARADVIVAGAVIVEQVCASAGASRLLVSDRGVRWGLAARLLRDGPLQNA